MSGKLPAETYHEIERNISLEGLRNSLKLKHAEASQAFHKKFPQVKEFLKKRGVEFEKLREHSGHVISAGALTGALLLSAPTNISLPAPMDIVQRLKTAGEATVTPQSTQKALVDYMDALLPSKTRPLTTDEEKKLEQAFSAFLGVNAKATLEGEHLNTTYGLIGAEQHLRRYPGDSMYTHPAVAQKDEGMAPGLGGFGYFARSKSDMTQDDVEREKWYAVVQLMYLPDWNTRTKYLVNWYKYRKVLIINTQNGNAVVADIADAGPAAWTGKSFGGSPEVMNYLGGQNYKKGPVIIFFVDDPDNKVPLGPLEYNKQELPLGVKLTELNV